MRMILLPNVNTLVTYAIELSEKENITGTDKKVFALKVIMSAIDVLPDESDIEKSHKAFLLESHKNGNLSDIIDLVIDASKGNLNINKKIVTNIFLKCIQSIIKLLNRTDKQ